MGDAKSDLHGNVPDHAPVALLLVDVLNDLEFKGGEKLLPFAEHAALRIALLKERAMRLGIPVIYVNDNFGKWRSDRNQIIAHCQRDQVRGAGIARRLAPRESDYFVIKPKHSGFYCTTLDLLLKHLGTQTIVLCGFAGNVCVYFTAHDAHMRDYKVIIPQDCVASESEEDNAQVLDQMKRVLGMQVENSDQIPLEEIMTPKERFKKAI